jgi:GNAT superfamily N-acetyltransferase
MASPGEAAAVRIRAARVDDADVIATHRARMFADMGQLPPETFDTFHALAAGRLREMLARGEYVGWLAMPGDADAVIGGAGVQRRLVQPHPLRGPGGGVAVAEGRHAIVVNVFTEPAWRRRGVAETLMRCVLDWAEAERLDRLVLHASDQGRALYERLGFVPTNEMRFAGNDPP